MKVQRYEVPDFGAEGKKVAEVLQQLPMLAGNMALNFYQDSWIRQGYIDNRFERWKTRQGKEKGKQRAILIGKGAGALRRSLRLTNGRGYFEVVTNLPYAKAHNEGATMAITAKQRKFFWAKYYEIMKKMPKKKDQSTKAQKETVREKRIKEEAEPWKNLALAKTITIPKRQFMGDSAFLRRRIAANVERAILSAVDGKYFGRAMLPNINKFFGRIRTTTG